MPDSKTNRETRVHRYPAVHLWVDELGETGDEGMTSQIEYHQETGLRAMFSLLVRIS